ncbi:MAG: glycosyltransferase family 2 protein [Desulforhopalus sp.]|nr:glycosyltransferase family 2 protein [Desulforhopalus sp.]
MNLLIYIPAFNEAKTIRQVIASIPGSFVGIEDVKVLVVNDGSSDNTTGEAEAAGAFVVSHKSNKGVGGAFQTAVRVALERRVDILCSIDADGQFDVGQISQMIKPIVQGVADFCIGKRFTNAKPANMPEIKYWGNQQVNRIVSWACGEKIEDASCGFRAYSKECLLSLNLQGKFTYTHETILDLVNKGFCIEQIPVSVKYFDDRVSRVANSLLKYGVQTGKIILKSLKDYKPFYFFGAIAAVVFIIGLIPGVFVALHWLLIGTISPYKGLGILSVLTEIVAVIFFVLALIADILGRIRDNQEKIMYLLKSMKFKE